MKTLNLDCVFFSKFLFLIKRDCIMESCISAVMYKTTSYLCGSIVNYSPPNVLIIPSYVHGVILFYTLNTSIQLHQASTIVSFVKLYTAYLLH